MYRDCCGFKLSATESALWKKPTHWRVDFSTIKSRMWPFALIATQTWRYPLPMMTSEKKQNIFVWMLIQILLPIFCRSAFWFLWIYKNLRWLNENEPICVLSLLYGIFRLWRRCTQISSYTYCTWIHSIYLYFYILSFKLHLF